LPAIASLDRIGAVGEGSSRPITITAELAHTSGPPGTVATEKGVTLRSMKVIVENKVNLEPAFGLGDSPVVEEVSICVVADSDSGDEALAEVEKAARERCPGVYRLTQPIPLRTRVERG
jgi:hypothetical protein